MSARNDPLLPNAAIVARREYRDRIRSPFFVVSTILLMALALGVALAPVFIRYLDSRTVARVVVISSDGELGSRAVATADSLLNIPPGGIDPADWKKPYRVESGIDEAAANALLARGEIRGILVVERLASGQLDVVFRTDRPTDVQSRQTMGLVGIVLGVYDWTSNLPNDVSIGAYQPPAFQVDAVGAPTEDGRPIDAQQIASRGFLGVVFVVLLFLTVIIYGMWVATGVAAEKSSRVMELMISAASPRQLLTGKVVGIGGAGLTQYVAIAVPALVVVGLQDRIAIALMGPAGAAAAPIAGLTPGLLLGYGVFFLLGFALFALIYAAMGSFVSRPDDLQTLVAAAQPARDGRVSRGGLDAQQRRWRRADTVALVRPAVQPVRDAGPAHGGCRHGGGAGGVRRDPAGDDRVRRVRGGPHVRGRRAAVRPTAGLAGLHRGSPARGVRPERVKAILSHPAPGPRPMPTARPDHRRGRMWITLLP